MEVSQVECWFDELSPQQQQHVLKELAEAYIEDVLPHTEVVKMFAHTGLK